MKIDVHTNQRDYSIYEEHGILDHAAETISRLGDIGRVFLISDNGVSKKWRDKLQAQYPESPMHVVPHGEASKCFAQLEMILSDMLDHHLSRNDTIVALGGGVVGDLSGFAASVYMRGIRYVNIPTTMLSMVDSSIGGKTAVDMNGIKNCVGTFWQPSMVLIDPEVLSTLSPRLVNEGLAESVKAGLIRDPELFEIFEKDDYLDHIDEIIERSLIVKRDIVEHDEREGNERKLLNFGHTYGHAYESYYELEHFLHGEAVGMGMMTILKNPEIKQRLAAVLTRMHLPLSCDADPKQIVQYVLDDKKADHDHVTIVQVDEIGKGHLEDWNLDQIRKAAGL